MHSELPRLLVELFFARCKDWGAMSEYRLKIADVKRRGQFVSAPDEKLARLRSKLNLWRGFLLLWTQAHARNWWHMNSELLFVASYRFTALVQRISNCDENQFDSLTPDKLPNVFRASPDRTFHENFTTIVTLNKEVPAKFWKSSGSGVWIHIQIPDTNSRSGQDYPWLRSALSNCSCFWCRIVLMDCKGGLIMITFTLNGWIC